MKKIILMLMIVISCLSFSVSQTKKLATDKKLHWDKIEGKWFGGLFEFKKQKGNYFVIITDYDRNVFKLKVVNGYILETPNKLRFAYDTQCKSVASLAENSSTKVDYCMSRNVIDGIN